MTRTSWTERANELKVQFIRQDLIDSGWNQSQAACALLISEYTIRCKIEKLKIGRPEKS